MNEKYRPIPEDVDNKDGISRQFRPLQSPSSDAWRTELPWTVPYPSPRQPSPLELPLRPTSREQYTRPGVVEIPTLRLVEEAKEGDFQPFKASDPTAQLYMKSRDGVARLTVETDEGTFTGSGFFISTDGKLVTDHHVIEGAKSIKVETTDGNQFQATVSKSRSTSDLAVLDVKSPDKRYKFHSLPLADSTDSLKSGDRVVGLGHPHGWEDVYASPGVVQELRAAGGMGFNPQRLTLGAFVHLEKGNSGGPLLNEKGEVIGVARNIFDQDQTALRSLAEEKALISNFTRVEDLHGLLGNQPSREGDATYLMPKRLNLNADIIGPGALTGITTYGFVKDLRAPTTVKGGFGRNVVVPLLGGAELVLSDFPFLKTAMTDGSTAEKINAGINVSGDLMMMAGPLMRMSPRMRMLAGTVQLAGAGIKLGNQLLAGRKFD